MKRLYYGGNILTMQDGQGAKAVLAENGKILALGDLDDINDVDAEKLDLCGKTLMPSFIDAHSHFSQVASSFLQLSLDGAETIDEVKRRFIAFIEQNSVKRGEWVLANGFFGKQMPSSSELSEFTKENPAVIMHVSGHMGVFNALAVNALSLRGSGYYEETEYFQNIAKVPSASEERLLQAYEKAEHEYLSNGITTVQDGMVVSQMLPVYKTLFSQHSPLIDVVGYAAPDAFEQANAIRFKHYKTGGIKIFLDGSPQGKTAWMKTPYLGTNSYGTGTMSDEDVKNALRLAVANKTQLLAHCNGDAAAQQFISCVSEVEATLPLLKTLRPVMIHAQLLRESQLESLKELCIIPSFFVSHVYYFGDTHIENFGFDRASKISPCAEALRQNILFTFHQDAPVVKPDMLFTVWCAVNRLTKSGVALGEKIDVYNALKAVTINAAYQYFAENEKGSIDVGKNEDFVVLDKNPLDVLPCEIDKIKVLQTISRGEPNPMRF